MREGGEGGVTNGVTRRERAEVETRAPRRRVVRIHVLSRKLSWKRSCLTAFLQRRSANLSAGTANGVEVVAIGGDIAATGVVWVTKAVGRVFRRGASLGVNPSGFRRLRAAM